MILSQSAFTIQCCWLRYQCRRRNVCRQSATLIQAGKLLKPWLGTTEWNQQSSVCSLPLHEPAGFDLTVWPTGTSWQSLYTVLMFTGCQCLSLQKLPHMEAHLINC